MMGGYAAALLFTILVLPSSRHVLERVMLAHMLVQIPLLAGVGVLGAGALPASLKARIAKWNRGGLSGTLLAIIASSWWMVPRALDLALASPLMEATKFATVPLLVGLPIALSWSRLGAIGRGFVLANVLPMWAVVGWAYIAAPVRVCNYYLVDQQVMAGAGLLIASLTLGVAVGLLPFFARAASHATIHRGA